MKNSWVFPVVESLHLIGMALWMGTIVLADLRTLGLSIQLSKRLTPWTHTGLAILLLTGTLMFWSDIPRYMRNPAFHFKLTVFVLALISHFTIHRSGSRFTAALSLALWTCVVLGGRAIADFDL